MTLPLAAVFLVVCLDLAVGNHHFLAPMMVTAPALAAGTTTWRRTLVVGLVGAVAQSLLIAYNGLGVSDQYILVGLAVSYAAVTLFSAYGAWWREERTAQYRAVVSVAEAAQRALLRPPGPVVGNVRLAVRYASAADAAQIGGDLYAVLDTPHGVRALVGDVRGKGLEAVQTSSVVMGAFREAAYDEGGLAKVAERVDASVRRHVVDGEFTTALFLEFPPPALWQPEAAHGGLPDGSSDAPPATGTPRPVTGPGAVAGSALYSPSGTAPETTTRDRAVAPAEADPEMNAELNEGLNAETTDESNAGTKDETSEVVLLHYGHVPALRVAADGTVTSLEPPEPWVPLGLTEYVAGTPEPWRVRLAPDEVLVLCTDGVVEARGAKDGRFYPLVDRAASMVGGCSGDLDGAVHRLYADLLRHVGGTLGDDAVLLLLSRPSAATPEAGTPDG